MGAPNIIMGLENAVSCLSTLKYSANDTNWL